MNSLRSWENLRQGTRHCLQLCKPTGDVGRSARSTINCRFCPNMRHISGQKWQSKIDLTYCPMCPVGLHSCKQCLDLTQDIGRLAAHPLKIPIYDNRGDFFVCRDSFERHCKNLPWGFISVTPEKAAAKRREMQRLHEQFRVSLRRSLEKGEVMG